MEIARLFIPLMSKTDYTYTFLYTLPGLGPCLLNIEIFQGTAKSQVRLPLLKKMNHSSVFYMYLVPVMVTFFISSSVCRHCKTTYDVFGVLLLNLRKIWLSNKFLFYQSRGLSASASGFNTSPGPSIFSCMENHV